MQHAYLAMLSARRACRRLCILKGVHPREPKKKFKGQNKTYYHVKDINFLAHEPLLEAFRFAPAAPLPPLHSQRELGHHTHDAVTPVCAPVPPHIHNLRPLRVTVEPAPCRRISAHEKKVRKARARRNHELAKQLARRAPTYKLDHLVRERYPTFLDALRDIDDALCMVHLFATLPADAGQAIPAAAVATSRRVVLEWQAYCVRTSAIRKVFISVKGYYFQVRRAAALLRSLDPC